MELEAEAGAASARALDGGGAADFPETCVYDDDDDGVEGMPPEGANKENPVPNQPVGASTCPDDDEPM